MQLPAATLDLIEERDLNQGASPGTLASELGLDLLAVIGLTVPEATAFQKIHDGAYRKGKVLGDDRAVTNQLYIKRVHGYVAGTFDQSGLAPLVNVVDFEKE